MIPHARAACLRRARGEILVRQRSLYPTARRRTAEKKKSAGGGGPAAARVSIAETAVSSRLRVDRSIARDVPVGHALRRGRGGGEAEPGRGGSHRARAQVFRARAERVGPGDRDARGRGRAAATGGVPGGRAHGDDRATGEHGVHLTRAWSGLCRVKMRRRTRAAVAFKTCRFAANWLDIFARLPFATF